VKRPVATALLLPLLVLPTAGFSCGGGGGAGGGGGGGGRAVDELARWVESWSDDAARGTRRPPKFDIPAPPTVALGATATQLGAEVARAEPPFSRLRARVWNENTQTATEYTQSVMCEWFGWYVEDPAERPVPGTDAFLVQFAKSGLKVVLKSPPSQELREAAETFRKAIERGQNSAEDVRNGAIAAVCAIPVGG
jgi:hypothetical protein